MLVNPFGIPVLKIGRDVNGRFRPGNPGGPGNPFARKVASLRKALLDSVSEEDLKEIVEILKTEARRGDKGAIRLIFQYCIGKPAQPQDPDRMDRDEWDRLQKMRVPQKQFHETMEDMPACLACACTEEDWPCEAQSGPPLDYTIRDIRQAMLAGDPTASPSDMPDPASTDSAQPQPAPQQPSPVAQQATEANTPSEAPAPKQGRTPSAKEQRKPKERRESARDARRESQQSAEPPVANEQNDEEQLRTIELLQRAFQPSQPSDQPQSKPPKG